MTEKPQIHWEQLPFAALDAAQLYAIFRARAEVFVVEQKCPYLDIDDIDHKASHLIGWGAPNSVAAYLRIIPPGLVYNEPVLGRVLTTAPYRGSGTGRELVKRGIEHVRKSYPAHGIRISAQSYLEKFHGEFGFQTVSEPYDEDGISHVEMLLNPDSGLTSR